jgi:MerR family transcriptional regulator, copper efflux regulator
MTTTEAPEGRYRIAEIARLSGFSPSALRYYEQAGVLAAPERTPAGYRRYSDRDLDRLRLIARAKDLGCTLEEIAELALAWDSDECGPVKHRLRALVRDKVSEVEAHLAEQAVFADQLRSTAAALAGRPLDGPCDDSCGCTTATGSGATTGSATGATGCGTTCGCGSDDDTVELGRHVAHDGAGAVPIACSLSGRDMAARAGEWQDVLAGATQRTPLPGGVRVQFEDRARLAELVALVDAEQTCCPFFSFVVTIDQRGLALEVTAPPDGQDLLTSVFGDQA